MLKELGIRIKNQVKINLDKNKIRFGEQQGHKR